MADKKVRTRFAPSPTGFMHVGGVRTALFAWLVARQASGEFLLRFEDTDRQRHIEEAESHITDSLRWLGLDWDNEIYRQSEHLEDYKKWAQKLVDSGRAYVDESTEEERNRQRQQSKQEKKIFRYCDYRPNDTPEWTGNQALRFRSETKQYNWEDVVMGSLTVGEEAIDDFIIMKSDGYPTYPLAHIVDDYAMGISHIMRSQEFASSIPKFLNLYEALGIEPPKMATLPYVLAPDGKKKLSKRDGAKDALHYKREGYLPEALVNFLATLGWNDGTEQEIFSREELIAKFKLDRVQKSGAHFDERRLQWMNGHYIRGLELADLNKRAQAFWPAEARGSHEDYKSAVLALVQERLKYFDELESLTKFFFVEPPAHKVKSLYDAPVDKKLRKIKDRGEISRQLSAVMETLSGSDFTEQDIRERLNKLLDELPSEPAILYPIIRIALTGESVSPEIFGTLSVLGKEKSLRRLKNAEEVLMS